MNIKNIVKNTIFLIIKESLYGVEVLSVRTDIPDDIFDVRIVCGDRKID